MLNYYRRTVLFCTGLLLLLGLTPAFAQDITLKSADGSVKLSGTLLNFDGEFYRINTIFGEMTLNALGVECTGLRCPDPGQYAADVTVSGARGAVLDLLPALIEDFGFSTGLTSLRSDFDKKQWTYFLSDSRRIPEARIEAHPSTSASGFGDLINGKTDLVVSTRRPNSREIQAAARSKTADLTSRWHRHFLAVDALVFIVSPENPISSLSIENIAAIFSGRITNWADLGGFDAPIALVRPNTSSEIYAKFIHEVFPQKTKTPLPAAQSFSSNSALSDAVAADPFAIGFTSFSGVRNAKPLALRAPCGIRQYPTKFGLQSGDYPLSSYIYLFTPRHRPSVFMRNFLAFLDSPLGENSVSDQGFASLAPVEIAFSGQQERIANALRVAGGGEGVPLAALKEFVTTLSGANRLSATIRFLDSSTEMNARSIHSISSLARKIESGAFDGRELMFIGYSDTNGSAAGNRKISRQRAGKAMKAVKSAARRANLSRVRFRAIGMGQVSPVACNDTDRDRRLNRRVEIWVR